MARDNRTRVWNDTAAVPEVGGALFPAGACLHELFERQVERTPAAPALAFAGQEISYAELNRRANRLAHYLRSLAVGPGVLVGLCLDRSPELIVGLLGVLKAGGAYLPLDPAYPADRLAYMLSDSQVRVVVTAERLKGMLPAHDAAVVCLDADGGALVAESDANPAPTASVSDLAYVIYTSGSTGRPKGVMVEHRGIANLAFEHARSFGVGPGSRVLQFASISFDASVWEVVMALLSGATLCLEPKGALLPGPAFLQLLRERRITIATLPPSFLASLPAGDLPDLRTIVTAGEACSAELVARWAPGRRFFNAYGPTESTICATMAECVPDGQRPTIGRPIANTLIYILDETGSPVPVGAPGEIYIGGVPLARGYLNQPALTAERFVPDTLTRKPGVTCGRLYRTGDLGRWLPDGRIEFLGRVDHQVKIRGFRIELGEIEATLSACPGVREAVVLAREDEPGEKRLVAYVVAAPGEAEAPSTAGLRQYLTSRLPDYMLPTAFVWLEAMPLTTNGKIDRQALPAPDTAAQREGEGFVQPRTPLEETVANVWGEVLGTSPVGALDHFFTLGGHSLRAAQVMVRLQEALQADLPITLLFEHPTVADLAAAMEPLLGAERRPHVPVIRPAPRDQDLPLALSQEPIWFLQKLSPGLLSYNAQSMLRFRGRLDIGVLERSLSEIVRRHEILRTTFPEKAGRPIQQIHDPWTVTIPIIDLQALSETERESEAERLFQTEFQKQFDLTRLPLVRWTLLRLSPEEHVLIQVEHHFVHDGWSYSVFLHELEALYLAFHAGKPSPLPDLPVQYADFACRQREWLQSGVAEAQLAYWRERLAGSPPVLELPTDRPRPAQQSFRGRSVRIQLPSQVAREVRAFCQREGVTLYVALLSAFHVLLHRYTGRTDLCLGSGIANRRWRETENLIGMIINTVALRTQFPGNATFRDLMRRVRTTVLEAQAHADVPFDQVVDALQPERSLSYLPIYQHAFSFHNTPMPAFNLPDLAVSITEGNSYGSAKFDINVVVIPRAQQRAGATGTASEEEIAMVWEYQTDLYDHATIERMIGHYQTLLAASVADPGRPIGEVPLLTPAEREWLRTQWTGPAMAFPQDRCVHQLVEEHAALRPDSLAVAGQGMALTYRELDERAARLAHTLRSRGVAAGSVVATCMERSPQLIVSMLAAWKAGAAYMPIDPRHPAELVSFMLNDARPAALLTDSALVGVETGSMGCIIRVDAEPAAPALHPAVSPDVGSPAYIIYTSGSTGRPKGVVVEHRSLLNLLCWTRQEFGLTPTDRATQVAGQGFDASVWEIWSALTTGASLHIADEALRSDPVGLRDWLVAQQITFCFAPTPMAEALLALPWPADTALRTLQTGGDRLQVFPPPGLPFALHNNYGPTEATVITTACLVEPGGTGGSAPSIGRPIANMRICLLDAGMQPVPVGVPGELCVGGVGVARGYLNREELTRERFVPDSFSGEPGARLYRTGDLARCRPDGSIEFIGRLDQQVKIRGFRIELGEIEFALGAHPGVSQAVVAVYDGGSPGEQNRRLVGYVVPAPGARPSPAELRAFLKERLPAHMVPSGFVLMEALPLTPNGKVDRQALPAPTEADRAAAFVGPRTAVEQVLAQVWSEVLGTAQVGIHDNFFELGGHSLMVAQTLSRIRSATGAELPIKELFDSPTIAELAPKVEQARLAQTDEEELARILAEIDELPQ